MKFKAGTYYVGDVCYVVQDKDWDGLLEKSNYFNCQSTGEWNGEYNGHPMFVASTAYGDGCYQDNQGRDYLVDAGLIGIMPVEAITTNPEGRGGQIIKFEEEFDVKWDEGEFTFGDVIIETRDVCECCGEAEPGGECCYPDCGESFNYCECGEYCGHCGEIDCEGECEDEA